jgi:hypothetical protein
MAQHRYVARVTACWHEAVYSYRYYPPHHAPVPLRAISNIRRKRKQEQMEAKKYDALYPTVLILGKKERNLSLRYHHHHHHLCCKI